MAVVRLANYTINIYDMSDNRPHGSIVSAHQYQHGPQLVLRQEPSLYLANVQQRLRSSCGLRSSDCLCYQS
jgi:hypothetical protein